MLKYLIENSPFDMSDNGTFATGSHARICHALDMMAKTDPKFRKFAIQFQDFLRKRRKVDYELDKDFSIYELKQCEKYYENLYEFINNQ